MPPKVRVLIKQLKAAGFVDRGGKGSHKRFRHPSGVNITLSGKTGSDAKRYQVRDVERVIRQVANEQE